MDQTTRTFHTYSSRQTHELARRLGSVLVAGDFIALVGPLGAGKTCFVQGLADGMGIGDNVSSPTFIIMRCHLGQPGLCHVDAYRISGAAELEDVGILDLMDSFVIAVEWAERVSDLWPQEVIVVRMQPHGDARQISITGRTTRLQHLVSELEQ